MSSAGADVVVCVDIVLLSVLIDALASAAFTSVGIVSARLSSIGLSAEDAVSALFPRPSAASDFTSTLDASSVLAITRLADGVASDIVADIPDRGNASLASAVCACSRLIAGAASAVVGLMIASAIAARSDLVPDDISLRGPAEATGVVFCTGSS